MADLLVGVSQSSLLLLQPKLGSFQRLKLLNKNGYPRLAVVGNSQLRLKGLTVSGVVSSDSKAPTIFTNNADFAKGGTEIEVNTGNGGGDKFDDRSGDGGGGGGDNSGGGDSGDEGEGEFSDDGSKKNMALSVSQILTLGYGALVGVGGVVDYMKSGSLKSLLAGGLSAALLYFVYVQLPETPFLASLIGFGISFVLPRVMGMGTGKLFPAVVSLVSFAMSMGYMYGIWRSSMN